MIVAAMAPTIGTAVNQRRTGDAKRITDTDFPPPIKILP
jgi:hypothetical protein